MKLIVDAGILTSLVLLVLILLAVIYDLAARLGTKVQAEILFCSIVSYRGLKKSSVWYDAKITYKYDFKGRVYEKNTLNGFARVLRRSRTEVEELLNGKKPNGKVIEVYVSDVFPWVSAVFPFGLNKYVMLQWFSFAVLGLVFFMFFRSTL